MLFRSVAKYLTPSGRDINKHGIDPDIQAELTEQQREALAAARERIGTSADPQYARALTALVDQVREARTTKSP